MSAYPPPTEILSIFNSANYDFLRNLTIMDALDLFVLNTGGSVAWLNITNYLQYNGSAIPLSALTSITPGTALASKALILDNLLNITDIHNIVSTGYNLQSVGTSPVAGVGLATWFDATSTGFIKSKNWTTTTLLDLNINSNSIFCRGSDGYVSICKATNLGYALDVQGDLNISGSYRVAGVASNLSLITGITTLGVGQASKALTVSAVNTITLTGISLTNASSVTSAGNFYAASYCEASGGFYSQGNFVNPTSGGGCQFAYTTAGTDHGVIKSCSDWDVGTKNSIICNDYLTIGATALSSTSDITTSTKFNSLYSVVGGQLTATNNGFVAIQGDGTHLLDGNYTIAASFKGSYHTSDDPVELILEVDNRKNDDPAHAAFIGTNSVSDLKMGTGNSSKMTIKADGYVYLYGNYSYTWVAHKDYLNWDAFADSDNGTLAIDLMTSHGAAFGGNLMCTSDRRLKDHIVDLDISVDSYLKWMNPKQFHRTDSGEDQVGFISQDMAHIHPLLINCLPDPSLHAIDDDDIEGCKMLLNYDRITAVNCVMIRTLIRENQLREQEIALSIKSMKSMMETIDNLMERIIDLENK
jgi:hypothetical protein